MRVFFCYHQFTTTVNSFAFRTAPLLFSCFVLLFGYLISWIKMLIFVNFSFPGLFYYWVIMKNAFVRLFVCLFSRSFLWFRYFLFLFYCVVIRANFVIENCDFLVAERVADGILLRWGWRSRATTKKITHIRMNGLYLLQVKNIRRISNVRKLSMYISVICADQRKAPKIHPQNTMQLILSSELNFKKQNQKYTKPPKHPIFRNADERKKIFLFDSNQMSWMVEMNVNLHTETKNTPNHRLIRNG